MASELYGIPNCDTVKKARAWMDARAIAKPGGVDRAGYAFIDVKKTPPTAKQLRSWCEHVGWEVLVNRQGTTWRKLAETEKTAVVDVASAVTLLLAHPTIMKRPVLVHTSGILVGFREADYVKVFSSQT
jgi:arsenate reductase (glutaredoxin)